jgi:hypothetical protein
MTSPANPAPAAAVPDRRTKWAYRRRGLANLLKMGHCAPAVMRTLLDLEDGKQEWLVQMTAGLPGGIGSTGHECGGVTSPLIRFGLEHGLRAGDYGLPWVIHAGHDYNRRFRQRHHSLLCKEILGKRRVPLPCIKVVCLAPEMYRQTDCEAGSEAISGGTRDAFLLLYSHLRANDFHCAHAVLKHLDDTIPASRELLDGTSGFIGGTAFNGLTCSAFSAGLMAVGLKLGEIEGSYLRVMRMLAIMIAGGNALADHLNKFNRLVNIGQWLAQWFRGEFGSTLCREIVQSDFTSIGNVQGYIEKGSVTSCKIIAEKVARQAERIIRQNGVWP